MAVLYSLNPLEWRLTDTIVVAEQTAAAAAELVGNTTAQILGDFPWGPADTLIKISKPSDFKTKLLGEASDYEDYAGARAIDGKVFSSLEVVRAVAADAAAASRTVGAAGFTINAKYKGAAGNQISTLYTNNGDDTFDLRITWGGYSKTHKGLTLATLASLQDDYVTLAAAGAGDTLAASDVSAAALTGGSNGTFADSDWTGSTVSVRGIRVLENGEGRITCVAGRASAAMITALRAHVDLLKGFGVMQAAADLGDFDAAVLVADGVADERLALCLHGVKVLHNGVEVETELAPFAASLLTQIPQHYSLADAEYCRSLLKSIIGPADGVSLSRGAWIEADGAGGLMLEALKGGAHKFHANITTDPAKPLISSRRVVDLAVDTVVAAVEPVHNKPDMPAFDQIALAQTKKALRLLKGRPEIPQTAYIADGGVVITDPLASGDKILAITLNLHGEIRYLILNITAGIALEVDAAAAA